MGAKRCAAGLADVPINSADIKRVQCERAARSLTAILPYGSAGFILGDPEDAIRARDPLEVAELMVDRLSTHGVSALESATGVYGRLATFVATTYPGAPIILGSHVTEWLKSVGSSAAITTGLVWLRDWAGVDLPARGSAARRSMPRVRSDARLKPRTNDKESLSARAVFGFATIAERHPSPLVRGHAAGWYALAKLAMRVEQSSACSINALVKHSFGGCEFTICCASVHLDKHPDASKQRPRPAWAILATNGANGAVNALLEMIEGAEELTCILRDTDSPSGSPVDGTQWLMAPLKGATRVDASLHSLLEMDPICMPPDVAARFHGHSAKRFLINVAESSPGFEADSANVGRFFGSTAQARDLEPTDAMLLAHSARISMLPALYANKSKVVNAFNLLARLEQSLHMGAARAAVYPTLLSHEGGWGDGGLFSSDETFDRVRAPATLAIASASAAPLQLTHTPVV